MGKERSVIQQPRLPLQPFHGHRHPGPRETLGQGTGNQKHNGTESTENIEMFVLLCTHELQGIEYSVVTTVPINHDIINLSRNIKYITNIMDLHTTKADSLNECFIGN